MPWNHVSPSQIESYLKCPRSWYFKSILKIPEGQKGHQSLGEGFHLIMEKVPSGLGWPNRSDVNATPEDWDKADALAKIALPLLPGIDQDNYLDLTPISALQKREQGIRLDTYENGPTMVGYVDLGIPVGIGWPALLIPKTDAIVVDYKTLSDFRYMKTPQELAESVQMMTYAKWALDGLRGDSGLEPEYVRLVHLYAKTRGPFTRASIRNESAIVSKSEINSRWEKTLDTVREMSQVANCGSPDNAEARGALNGHCEAYGGCFFRDKCGIPKVSGIKGLFQISKKPQTPSESEQSEMSGSTILERIKQAQAKAASEAAGKTLPASPAATSSAPIGTAQAVAPGIRGNTTPAASPVASGSPSASPGATTSVMPDAKATVVQSPVVNSTNPPAGPNLTLGGLQVAPKPITGLLAKIESRGQGKPALAGALAQTFNKEIGSDAHGHTGTGELGKLTISTLGDLMKLATGVIPPDAPSRAQEVITRPGDAVAEPNSESIGDDDDAEEDDAGNPLPGNTGSSGPMAVSSEAPAKRRGRPSNAELEARRAQENAALEARIEAEVQKRLAGRSGDDAYMVGIQMKGEIDKLNGEIKSLKLGQAHDAAVIKALQENSAGSSSSTDTSLTLYVDCFPTKGDSQATDFFEWIGPICAKVAQQNSVADWRQINYTAKGLLATAIRETIREHGTPKSLVISTFAGGADIALEVLTPIAKRVIKKV